MNDLSIYLHWPFCKSLCPYCDFNSHINDSIDHNLWLNSYVKELEYFSTSLGSRSVKSIFFGGGTPSLMQPFVVENIISRISKLWNLSSEVEITLEANPTSFEINKFKDFKSAGVNRVSIGVQSFEEASLKYLGREHSSRDAIKAIESASKLFLPKRCSFDLIYARPGQNLENWQHELHTACEFNLGHLSLYQLTIEKGTPFYKLHRDGLLLLPENDIAANMQEWTDSYLQERNYCRYEISNYAKLGAECIHNLAYWHYKSYLGIGPGAHSRIHENYQTRSMMMWHKPQKWLDEVSKLGAGIQLNELLSKNEIVEEFFMMGLRLKEGINLKLFNKLLEEDPKQFLNISVINEYEEQGFIKITDNDVTLSDKGLLLHNYIVPRILNTA